MEPVNEVLGSVSGNLCGKNNLQQSVIQTSPCGSLCVCFAVNDIVLQPDCQPML